jgi:16S rRNA processing protein RimM
MTDTTELVTIGKIVKPFGVGGELRVLSLSDVPGRFQGLKQVRLVAPSGRAVATTVSRVREDRGGYVVGVEALSTPEQAAVFRGGLIQISRDQTPPLPEGRYYACDLIGMSVLDETGRRLGTLEEILETGGAHVFVIRGEGREILIPATRQVVTKVDVEGRSMTVRLIEGLGADDAVV